MSSRTPQGTPHADAAEQNGAARVHSPIAGGPSPKRVHPLESFVLGSLAACGAVTATNPFDVVKTRLVLQGQLERHAKVLFRGPAQALRAIVAQEGPAALLKGLVPAYATQIFMNGTRLGLYPTVKRNIRQRAPPSVPDFFVDMFSGMGVGVVGAAVGSPFQMIKIRMQSYSSKAAMAVADQHKYRSLAHGLATVLREEGLAGWRRALDACMLKVAIASAVQLSVYDSAKGRLQSSQEWRQRFGATETHIAASLAASLAVVTVINPLEVVNTRLYNQRGGMYTGMADCFVKTLVSEGPSGLYKGFTAHFMRVAPHTVLTFVFLEALKRNLDARRSAAPTPSLD